VPQGAVAYVLSLTRWDERQFTGGETCILQPSVLDYWRGFDSSTGLEASELMTFVAPLFNRLTIFDARLPHGVARVEGERDPRGARLVIHGWFTEPEPFYEGGLSEEQVERGLSTTLQRCYEAIAPPCVTGLLSLRMQVSAEGTVETIDTLADLLVVDPDQVEPPTVTSSGSQLKSSSREGVVQTLLEELGRATFAPCDAATEITIPFVFD